MTTETKHTQGPWYFDGGRYVREQDTDGCIAMVCDDDGHSNPRARRQYPKEANGARIVRCVNSHDDLLAALRACVAALVRHSEKHPDEGYGKIIEQARAAIAKATQS